MRYDAWLIGSQFKVIQFFYNRIVCGKSGRNEPSPGNEFLPREIPPKTCFLWVQHGEKIFHPPKPSFFRVIVKNSKIPLLELVATF